MQLTLFDNETENRQQYSFGKTYLASCQQKTMRWDAFWEHLPEKAYRLNRQGRNGQPWLCVWKQTQNYMASA